MKNLLLLLSMCLIAKFSFAQTVHPNIGDDLDFKMESDYKESDRGVANLEDEQKDLENADEQTQENISNKDNNQDASDQRDIASDEEVFDATNENGIRYWKY
jgi:hypothetical protein